MKQIDFVGIRRLTLGVSLAMVLVSVIGIAIKGFNFGIDFTGGTLVEVGYPQAVEPQKIREELAYAGFDAQVQHFGTANEIMIRLAPTGTNQAQLSNDVLKALSQSGANPEMRRVEFVGPQVGDELTEDGALAVLYALVGILIYVAVRFEWRFATGSVLALIHDVTITLGVFAWLQLDFDLTVLAALLAVIGYSLNDTIVVFDRIRENFRDLRKATPLEVVNTSVNQTLSRTIMTSLTTLLVVFALFFLGGEIIHNFALALMVGIGVGTYSSIYVAAVAALALGISRDDLTLPEKDDQGLLKAEEEHQKAFLAREMARQATNKGSNP